MMVFHLLDVDVKSDVENNQFSRGHNKAYFALYMLYDCTPFVFASEQTSVNHLFTCLTDEASTSDYCFVSTIMAKVVLSGS